MARQVPKVSHLAEVIKRHRVGTEPGAAPKWDFDPDRCGDFGIRIARDGTWYYHGSPIGRKEICKLFSTVIRRDEQGRFYLVTPVEQGRIEVDDAPFTAVEVVAVGAGRHQTITFRTNLDHMVTAGPDHPIRVATNSRSSEPSPYVLVRDNLEALILRPQFYELVDLAEEREEDGRTIFGVWSSGAFFELGEVEQDETA